MDLEQALESVPVEQWTTRQAIVFDWYDGPRTGVCGLSTPECEFRFELLDERPNEDDLDDRLLRLSALPAGSVADVVAALRAVGEPAGPVWIPLWRFPTAHSRLQTERAVEVILGRGRPSSLVIWTRDLIHFLGWRRADTSRNSVTDWFKALGIPQESATSTD